MNEESRNQEINKMIKYKLIIISFKKSVPSIVSCFFKEFR